MLKVCTLLMFSERLRLSYHKISFLISPKEPSTSSDIRTSEFNDLSVRPLCIQSFLKWCNLEGGIVVSAVGMGSSWWLSLDVRSIPEVHVEKASCSAKSAISGAEHLSLQVLTPSLQRAIMVWTYFMLNEIRYKQCLGALILLQYQHGKDMIS